MFPSSKVFGVEGCETIINALWAVVETATQLGVEGIEMGMAHRGRMNVLHNFLGKRLSMICNRFNENELSELGDVKYHLGTRAEITVADDHKTRTIHMSLTANPSHLEAVNAVVIGKTKAKQFFVNDETMKRVIPILVHGDAAFSGQVIV
jgi:2-oxoglutarate dehydrogenase E1 component